MPSPTGSTEIAQTCAVTLCEDSRMLRVGLIGLGTIAQTHIRVVQSLPEVRLVYGADPGPSTAELPSGVPRFSNPSEALAQNPAPDLLVIATPTPTHVELVSQSLATTARLVLAEKPLSDSTAALDGLEDAHGAAELAKRLRVAHHFAFSPEVVAAERLIRAHQDWGRPVRVMSSFNDAYARKPASQLDGYVSRWIDSGPNQLSLLSRFVSHLEVIDRSQSSDGFRSVCRLSYAGGEALLLSNWWAGDTSKQTSLFFPDDLEVRMDHTSMTVVVLRRGDLVTHIGYSGDKDRKFAHYDGLYTHLLSGSTGREASYQLARDIAEMLQHPALSIPTVWR
jgi:Oxidoreductase family, NAD-binding Rossmann fold